jgi:plasmid maintenance system antidote protein VapI/GNAT superfamily N-acetyltransferase
MPQEIDNDQPEKKPGSSPPIAAEAAAGETPISPASSSIEQLDQAVSGNNPLNLNLLDITGNATASTDVATRQALLFEQARNNALSMADSIKILAELRAFDPDKLSAITPEFINSASRSVILRLNANDIKKLFARDEATKVALANTLNSDWNERELLFELSQRGNILNELRAHDPQLLAITAETLKRMPPLLFEMLKPEDISVLAQRDEPTRNALIERVQSVYEVERNLTDDQNKALIDGIRKADPTLACITPEFIESTIEITDHLKVLDIRALAMRDEPTRISLLKQLDSLKEIQAVALMSAVRTADPELACIIPDVINKASISLSTYFTSDDMQTIAQQGLPTQKALIAEINSFPYPGDQIKAILAGISESDPELSCITEDIINTARIEVIARLSFDNIKTLALRDENTRKALIKQMNYMSHALPKEQLHELINAMHAVDPKNLSEFTPDFIKYASPNLVKCISLGDIQILAARDKETRDALIHVATEKSVGSLCPDQCTALFDGMRSIDPDNLSAFTPEYIKSWNASAFSYITPEDIATLAARDEDTRGALINKANDQSFGRGRTLSDLQCKAVVAGIRSIDPVNLSSLTPEFLQSCSVGLIKHISTDEIKLLARRDEATRIALRRYCLGEQLAAVAEGTRSIDPVNLSGFTPEFIGSQNSNLIYNLTLGEIATLATRDNATRYALDEANCLHGPQPDVISKIVQCSGVINREQIMRCIPIWSIDLNMPLHDVIRLADQNAAALPWQRAAIRGACQIAYNEADSIFDSDKFWESYDALSQEQPDNLLKRYGTTEEMVDQYYGRSVSEKCQKFLREAIDDALGNNYDYANDMGELTEEGKQHRQEKQYELTKGIKIRAFIDALKYFHNDIEKDIGEGAETPKFALRLARTFGNDWHKWIAFHEKQKIAELRTNNPELINSSDEEIINKYSREFIELHHDIIHWLPTTQAEPGLSAWLLRFADRDVKDLSVVASRWNRLSPEDRQLPYKQLIEKVRALHYGEINHQGFAQEAYKHAVSEEAYPNYERRFIASQDVPSPFPLDKTWTSGEYTGRFIPRSDVRGLFLGRYTGCCQYPGDTGGNCAWYGQEKPNAGFFVIEDKQGNITHMSFAWINDHNIDKDGNCERGLCFDNFEINKSLDLDAQIAAKSAAGEIIKSATSDLSPRYHKITVGTGYSGIDHEIWPLAEDPLPLPSDFSGWSDTTGEGVTQHLLASNPNLPKLPATQFQTYVRGGTIADIEAAKKVAAACYPEGWQWVAANNIQHAFVLEDKQAGVVGYALIQNGNYIEDFAVMPEFQKQGKSLLLMRSLMQHIENEGGEWSADCRQSTSYKLIKAYEKRGGIKILEETPSGSMNGETMYHIRFRPTTPEEKTNILAQRRRDSQQRRALAERQTNIAAVLPVTEAAPITEAPVVSDVSAFALNTSSPDSISLPGAARDLKIDQNVHPAHLARGIAEQMPSAEAASNKPTAELERNASAETPNNSPKHISHTGRTFAIFLGLSFALQKLKREIASESNENIPYDTY